MTAQVSETLIYQGEKLTLYSQPLADYLAANGDQPVFEARTSALWRGYVGTWEIVDSRLYLVALRGWLPGNAEANLATLFPECGGRMFAYWYTGTLRVPQGKLIKYVHQAYDSAHERDLLFEVADGVVQSVTSQQNSTDQPLPMNGGMSVDEVAVALRKFLGKADE